MAALIDVILPVFLVVGFGYLAAWRRLFSEAEVDGLMHFAQGFAIPCLLFRAIYQLDLSQHFDVALLAIFYTGALTGFFLGLLGARYLFHRPWEDSVAIGFIGLFSNTVLLGLPITERAYGRDALTANYMIIAFHAPFGYLVGLTAMEIVRNRGGGVVATARQILHAVFSNALVLGILLGAVFNLGGVPLPGVATDALDLIIRAALPVALFGLGGVLYRYRPEGDRATIAYISAVSLIVHPVIVYTLGRFAHLDTASLRSAVLTAGVAPGVNAYLFANMYGVAKRVAASSVLIATALTTLSMWVWLSILP